MTGRGISSVLVANRGEVAVRICRTLAAQGLRSVAVYSPLDAGAPHVQVADVAVAVDGYLDGQALVAAARSCGADAVHPGYGFLSEDATFARAVLEAGLVWIGPPPAVVEAMGDKIRAKELAAAAGVPVVPGVAARDLDDAQVVAAALELGLPVLLKPAAGGGGKGMRRVAEPGELAAGVAAARREAAGAFGDDSLLVERWVDSPRHIEVQVFADNHGNVVHLGERECSLQRRHQKIVEESPSPLLDDEARAAVTDSAVRVARACGYVGAGTVEFLVPADSPGEHYFMEMNTRLQVEHPVTEAVTAVDLVDWQLRVAAGEPLPAAQGDLRFDGHAVEARVYAEDPARGFLPSTGTVVALDIPEGPGLRVDAALVEGLEIGTRFDPMLAKVVAWAPDRAQALARLRAGLARTTVLGVTTNIGYLVSLLGHPDVVAGRLDTGVVGRTIGELAAPDHWLDRCAAVVAACRAVLALGPPGPLVGPWDVLDGWRLGERAATEVVLVRDGESLQVSVAGSPADAIVQVHGGPMVEVSVTELPGAGRRSLAAELLVTIDGVTSRWHAASDARTLWVGHGGHGWRFVVGGGPRSAADRRRRAGGSLVSPMPGVVAAVFVADGDEVVAGQAIVAVEAMKMEHVVTAPRDGVVDRVLVRPGQAVRLDEPLAEMPDEATRAQDPAAANAPGAPGAPALGATAATGAPALGAADTPAAPALGAADALDAGRP